MENAGGGLIIGPLSDMGDSITTSGGGVGGRIGEGRVIDWVVGSVVEIIEWGNLFDGWSWRRRRYFDSFCGGIGGGREG